MKRFPQHAMSMYVCKFVVVGLAALVGGELAIGGGESGAGLTPAEAIERLQAGNARFVTGTAQHPNTDASRLEQTATQGQKPFATIITCSDSRVPVERVFDQGVGDVFVIRVAGNVCDTDEIGSIEYGVDHLATPVLLVLGHTNCGAVTAVVEGAELHGSIPPLVDNIKPAVERARKAHPHLHGQALVPAAVKENIWQAIDDLFKASPATRKRAKAGTLLVVGAVYDIATGEVEWLGGHPQQARLLEYKGGPAHHDGHESKPSKAAGGYSYEDYVAGAKTAKRSPDAAIAFLKQGNKRFVIGESIHPNLDQRRLGQAGRENQGDHAYATVITCSDSRVPVEHLFDAGIMDIFVIRVAGNVCDTDEIGSIEYGLAHVKTPVLVVLGHTQCGAVTAVTHAVHGKGHALERNIPPLVDNIQPAVKRAMAQHAHVHGDAIIPHAIEENVWQSIEDLFMESPATRELVRSGKAKVVGAIYDVGSGQIEWLPESKSRQLLDKAEANPNRAKNAMAGGGHGDDHHSQQVTPGKTPAAHGAAAVHAEPVALVKKDELQRLDRARQQTAHAVTVAMPPAERGLHMLWVILIGLGVVGGLGMLAVRSGLFGYLTVGHKLYGGFTAVVLLGVAGGWLGYHALDVVSHDSQLALAAGELDADARQMNTLQQEFILVGIEDPVRGEELLENHKALQERYAESVAAIHAEFELDEDERTALKSIETATREYDGSFTVVVKRFHEIQTLKEKLDELGAQMDEQLAQVVHEHEADLAELERAGAPLEQIMMQTQLVERLAECELLVLRVSYNEVGFLLDKKVERVAEMEQQLGQLRAELKIVTALIPECAHDQAEEKSDLATLAEVERELAEFQTLLGKVIKDELIVDAAVLACNVDLRQIEHSAEALAQRAEHEAAAATQEAHQAAIGMMFIVAVVGSLAAFFITRGIAKPLKRIIGGLTEGANQVEDASGQVSAASQQLAEGASEQASSLEETSSALEEMTAMTRTTADNAREAADLSGQARDAAQAGDQTMDRLNGAMAAINGSAGEISKIIKVIEEIAFQTNLLALNAAVEAARAGEHGKGFAVVAEEVRNLAQRCAQAAGETTGLIEDSVTKAKEGTSVASEVGQSLGAIVGNVTSVTDLINSIARAGEEQAGGVEQLNTAVSQVDKVVQQNAGAAEESASAAEQLAAQASAMKGVVQELSTMVGVQQKVSLAVHQRVSQPRPGRSADGAGQSPRTPTRRAGGGSTGSNLHDF